MKRLRIGTLMLLVVIAALAIALVVAEARLREQYAQALVARFQAQVRQAQAAESAAKVTVPSSR